MIWHTLTLKPGRVTRKDGQRFTLSEEPRGWLLTPDDPALPSHSSLDLFEACDVLNADGFKKI